MNFLRKPILVLIALILIGGAAFLIWAENLGGLEPPPAIDYAPNFWFDSEERYYPASPLAFYYDGNLEEIPGDIAKAKYDSLSLGEKLRNFTVFYKIRSEAGQWIYEYWPFYVFNAYSNDHHGDWEPIYVFVDKSTKKVNKVIGSAHNGSTIAKYLFFLPLSNNEAQWSGSNHVRILVEGGSHANWPDGNDNGLVNRFKDGVNWNAWGNTTWSLEDKLHGVKINYDNPNYKLEKLSNLEEKLKGKESLTKSPILGFLPFKIGSKKYYSLPFGGSPADLAYLQSVDDSARAQPITTESVIAGVTGFGEMVWGKVKSAGELVKNTASSIFGRIKNIAEGVFNQVKDGFSQLTASLGLVFKGSEPKGEYIPLPVEEESVEIISGSDEPSRNLLDSDESHETSTAPSESHEIDRGLKSAIPDEESATPDEKKEEVEEEIDEEEEKKRVSGRVIINEIAWMGTLASYNDEWIELYNLESYAINLSEWSLKAQDGSPEIELSGEIEAFGYFLLERTDDSTVSDIPADLIYTGALSNSGENLILADFSGNIVNQVDCSEGWFAGENEGKKTMERGENWHTNDGLTINGQDVDGSPILGTPRTENSAGLNKEEEIEEEIGEEEEEEGEQQEQGEEPEEEDDRDLTPLENDSLTGQEVATPVAKIVINEIMYDLEGSDSGKEWVEIFNFGESSVDLTGWKFYEDETNHKLNLYQGDATIPSSGYALIVDEPDKFLADWPNYSGILFKSSFSLKNTEEFIAIRDSNLNDIDQLTYNSHWGAKGDRNSLQRKASDSDSNASSNWQAGIPTPGALNLTKGRFSSGGGGSGYSPPPEDSSEDSSESEEENSSDESPPREREGRVIINEIAWMGTATSTADEWIELKNLETYAINLSEWSLKAEDGSPEIELSGKIEAQEYYLLERTDDNTISDVPADQTYTGALANGGENLILSDYSGSIIDQVNCSEGWFGGDNEAKKSMESCNRSNKSNGSDKFDWHTNDGLTINGHDAAGSPILGTPKAENSVGQSEEGGGSENPGENNPGENTSPTASFTYSPENPIIDEIITFNTASSTDPDGEITSFLWDFGDESVPTATSSPTITHSYATSSVYTVELTVTDDNNATSSATSTISVSEAEEEESFEFGVVVINEIAWMGTATSTSDEWIELFSNATSTEINLSGWTLSAQDGTPYIELLGEIPAQGYYLLERTDDNTVSDIPADRIYTGALGNDGEFLELRDSQDNLIDQVDCSGSWFAGDNESKKTMERNDPAVSGSKETNWHTNDGQTINSYDADENPILGTPKAQNSVEDTTPLANHLVINEIQILNYEFVELYNPTPEDIDMTGWYWSYFSSKRDWNNPHLNEQFPEEATIPAKGFYLIGLYGYSENDSLLDVDWSIDPYSRHLSTDNEGGSIAIFPWDPSTKTSEQARTGCIDALGWGSVDYIYESSVASVPGQNKSLIRQPIGWDTDNNSSDFIEYDWPSPSNSQGEIMTIVLGSTSITKDSVWTLDGSPYILKSDCSCKEYPTVEEGAILTIEPGVKIKGISRSCPSLVVKGTLEARGTAENPIVFTANTENPEPGDWKGIFFEGSQGSRLENVIFEYGGYRSDYYTSWAEEMIRVEDSTLSIIDSVFRNTPRQNFSRHIYSIDSDIEISGTSFFDSEGGIYAQGNATSTITITNSEFKDLTFYGIKAKDKVFLTVENSSFSQISHRAIRIYSAYPSLSGNSAESCGLINGVWFSSGSVFGQDFTLKSDLPYVFQSGITVAEGATLTLKPGVVIKAAVGRPVPLPGEYVPPADHDTLLVEGTLIAQGGQATSTKIVFTSLRDDSFGGDTNNDESDTWPTPGDWRRIVFASSSTGSVLDNLVLRYGGLFNEIITLEAGAEVDYLGNIYKEHCWPL